MRLAIVIVCVLATQAHADDALKPIAPQRWYQGKHGTNRVVHFSITTAALLAHPVFNFLEEGIECNWCGGPNALDAKVRNALVWSDTKTPARMSDISSYVLAPTAAFGLVLAGTVATPSTAAVMDDMIPIAEAMIVTQWVTRTLKITIARTRPYAHFTDASSNEDNLSFPSGHTSLPFALATSAGMIAHSRGYKSEPYIWAIGITLALSSGYLRIAADRHYVTDVATGALIGVSAGLTVPLLMSRDNVRLTPMGTGMAFTGNW